MCDCSLCVCCVVLCVVVVVVVFVFVFYIRCVVVYGFLLYTSDAADEDGSFVCCGSGFFTEHACI